MKNNKNVLNRKKFKECMDAIKKNNEYIDELNLLFRRCEGSGYVIPPSCVYELIKVLEFIFEDECEWIDYFVYDLDFGRDYHDGDITEGDKNIPLATVDDLYNLLISNLERNADV